MKTRQHQTEKLKWNESCSRRLSALSLLLPSLPYLPQNSREEPFGGFFSIVTCPIRGTIYKWQLFLFAAEELLFVCNPPDGKREGGGRERERERGSFPQESEAASFGPNALSAHSRGGDRRESLANPRPLKAQQGRTRLPLAVGSI